MSRKIRKTWYGLIFLFLFPSFLYADIYYYVDKNGVWHFTNIPADPHYRLYLRSLHKKASQYIKEYSQIIEKAARMFSVDPALIKAIIKVESNFNKRAVSFDGARGLMQLMPFTAREMNVSDPMDPEENIIGGVKYLSILLREFKDISLAIAAYNAGPAAIKYYKGIPPFPETRNFVRRVLRYYKSYKNKK